MNEITNVSLVDTLNVIQLARETALSKGSMEQARRFTPIVDEIQNLVAQSKKPNSEQGIYAGVLGQEDFRHMLYVAQNNPAEQTTVRSNNIAERNLMIQSMAGSDMTALEIARQMEMTLEEVNLVMSINERAKRGKELF